MTDTIRRRFRSFLPAGALLLLALCLTPALPGCGKKGMPQPQDSSKSFTWKEVTAKPVGNCLAFTGSFEGAYENFDGIRLELAALQSMDDCPGCPFVAKEVTEISARDAGFDSKTGSVAFSYCPQKGNAYRWRLAGISIFNRLPHATMTDRLLIVNSRNFAPIAPQETPEPAVTVPLR